VVLPSTDFDFNSLLLSKISIPSDVVKSRVDNELPSVKEALKNCFLNKTLLTHETTPRQPNATRIETTKKMNHSGSTEAAIPIVIAAKYTDNSSGDRTGFLNRTIDRAPTIPRDKAIFPDITFVITYVITGKRVKVAVWA
jgi:hypothetical protein